MAQGPWRCSQCGTINEPVANSCRSCGKWPSLFDLEDSTLDESEQAELGFGFEPRRADPEAFQPTTVQVATYEPPPAEVPVSAPEPEVVTVDEEYEQPRRRGWTSAIIPVAIIAYFVIKALIEG